jgi:hypothetical protein
MGGTLEHIFGVVDHQRGLGHRLTPGIQDQPTKVLLVDPHSSGCTIGRSHCSSASRSHSYHKLTSFAMHRRTKPPCVVIPVHSSRAVAESISW